MNLERREGECVPRVLYNGSIQGVSGKIENLIFRTLLYGTTFVSIVPAEKTRREKKRARLKRSAAQNAHNEHFRRGYGTQRKLPGSCRSIRSVQMPPPPGLPTTTPCTTGSTRPRSAASPR